MSNMSISGLASGLDTATIINQLMQLEAIPQTKLRAQLSSARSTVTTFQDLNARVASLTTKAAERRTRHDSSCRPDQPFRAPD